MSENSPKSQSEPSAKSPTHTFAEIAQKFLLGIAALSYATGFLVVFTFLERFGIRESATDVFKAKYIYVGILHLWLPLTVFLPFAAIRFINNRQGSAGESQSLEQKSFEQKATVLFGLASLLAFGSFLLMTKPGQLLIPIFIIVLSLTGSAFVRTLARNPNKGKAGKSGVFVSLANTSITVQFSVVMYIYIAFVPDFKAHELQFDKIFAASTLGGAALVGIIPGFIAPMLELVLQGRYSSQTIKFIRIVPFCSSCESWLEDGVLTNKVATSARLAFSLLLCLVICWLDYNGVPWGIVVEMLSNGGWRYPVFLALAAFVSWRVHVRSGRLVERGDKIAIWIAGLGVVLGLFYASILAFSARVYPYIPASKGGGDYSDTPLVSLVLNSNLASALPSSILATTVSNKYLSIPMVLIEENNSELYVANPNDPTTNARPSWRAGAVPKVLAIRRDQVIAILYQNGTNKP